MNDLPPSEHPRASDGKGDLHVPGAGTAGMGVLIVSLTMLFLASIAAYLIVRYEFLNHNPEGPPVAWPPAGLPHAPGSLWLSTLVILISSVTIQKALNAVRRDDEGRLLRFLKITFILGVVFLGLQTLNWIEFYRAIPDGTNFSGVYLVGFYVLTTLHAVHVIGGLIPLAVVIAHAKRGKYSRNFHPGVRYSTLYWHFLDIIWIILFFTILL